MKTELFSVSKIFTERILRIPDYQRGYAWTRKQIKDFWADLVQLEDGKSHYTGVLTLETVSSERVQNWFDDSWIIQSKGYSPFYVVDGQQRLTTTIILIQAIAEKVPEGAKLNYTSTEEIRKKFIFDSKDDGISRSYIFGYEKDNPSYEFLKTRIFLERSDNSFPLQETIYTANLESAKSFFGDRLKDLSFEEMEFIYRKLTQNFLFNIYSISDDVDVFVAFETMNNRGKPLSHLELLKNRLIYLSTRFGTEQFEKESLRHAINESWKSVYHFLGKNKANPLDDDLFLTTHSILYFGDELREIGKNIPHYRYYRGMGWYQAGLDDFLLEYKFSAKSLSGGEGAGPSIHVGDIYAYVQSLKSSVEIWYSLLNPSDSHLSDDEKEWLRKLNRLNLILAAPLIMVFFERESDRKLRVRLLRAVERYLFFVSFARNSYVADLGELDVIELSGRISRGEIKAEAVIREIDQLVDSVASKPDLMQQLFASYRGGGFYQWKGVRYFLFEYELFLKSKSKSFRTKLDWETLTADLSSSSEDDRDYYTVEHIYPQRPRRPCWTDVFSAYTEKERSALRHSLGNLVPLSQPKNSSFQNKCFKDKKGSELDQVGFRYGCYSENEVASLAEWNAAEILKRGLRMLEFLEKRWRLDLGTTENRVRLLSLEFVAKREGISLA